jgi:hypothetical protein
VAFTVDDADAANLITFTNIEIPDIDIPCLEFGTKAYLYNLEKDGKNTEKGAFWKQLYGGRDAESGRLTGELAAVKARVMKERGSTFAVMQERVDTDLLRTRPLYPWE